MMTLAPLPIASAKTDTAGSSERAVQAVRAGCDIVLASADAAVVADMAQALVTEAQGDPAFAKRVDESAARVLALKTES